MSLAEQKYDTSDVEMLIIIESCAQWQYYVKRASFSIQVLTDHVKLDSFFIIKTLSQQQVRWWEWLFSLNIIIKYQKEKLNPTDTSLWWSDNELTSDKRNELDVQNFSSF